MSAQTGSGNRNTIIIVVVVVVLLCCCCLLLGGAYYAFTQGMLNSIIGVPTPSSQSLLQLLG